MGDYFGEQLKALAKDILVGEVRGLGLFWVWIW